MRRITLVTLLYMCTRHTYTHINIYVYIYVYICNMRRVVYSGTLSVLCVSCILASQVSCVSRVYIYIYMYIYMYIHTHIICVASCGASLRLTRRRTLSLSRSLSLSIYIHIYNGTLSRVYQRESGCPGRVAYSHQSTSLSEVSHESTYVGAAAPAA